MSIKICSFQNQQKNVKSDNDCVNEQQRHAIEHADGPLLIVAGPGTGKTHTLTRRIAHVINQNKVSSDNILAITFTRKAAGEMADRLESLIDKEKIPWVTTFHSLAYKILSDIDDGPKKDNR